MLKTRQSNADDLKRVHVSRRCSKRGGGTTSPRRKLVRKSPRSRPSLLSEEKDSNQALLNATEETNFSLSLRISSKYGEMTNYDPIEFIGCRFEDGSIGWKTGQVELLERVPISYLEGEKGRRTKGAVPCTLFAYVVMNDTIPKGASKGKKEYKYGEPVATEESSDPTDNELKEDSEEEERNDTGSAAESSHSTTSEKDEVEGGSQNEASSSEEEEVDLEDKANEVSVDSIKLASSSRTRARVGGEGEDQRLSTGSSTTTMNLTSSHDELVSSKSSAPL